MKNEYINLVENGIFPIKLDHNGNNLNAELDTGFQSVGTVQGEGKSTGVPCFFIRTSGCNLRCAWVGVNGKGSPCDTPYSSHFPEKNKVLISDIVKTITLNNELVNNNIKHIVISGGEPFLQSNKLALLCAELYELGYEITIETNGTIFDEEVMKYVKLISISPKLSNSTPWEKNLVDTGIIFNNRSAESHEATRRNLDATYNLISAAVGNLCDFQLKFVVNNEEDLKEIMDDYITPLRQKSIAENGFDFIYNDDILLMPEGIIPDDLEKRHMWVVETCIKNGFRFSPRMHALLFGVKRGV